MNLQHIEHTAGHQQQRVAAERLLAIAEHLNPAERALIESIYERGISPTELARATGVPPALIRARLRRLLSRINSPATSYVIRHRLQWSATQRRIADAIFLRGQTQRDTAAQTRVSVHRVRQEIARIRALAEHHSRT